jgi:hypothetical protein
MLFFCVLLGLAALFSVFVDPTSGKQLAAVDPDVYGFDLVNTETGQGYSSSTLQHVELDAQAPELEQGKVIEAFRPESQPMLPRDGAVPSPRILPVETNPA